jgi:protein AroM
MRPDLDIIEAGALDHTAQDALPTASGRYPLVTRLRSGASVTIDQAVLAPLLQQALDRLEAQGAIATMLLCAGTFAALRGRRPLYKPFDLVKNLLQSAGVRRIGLVAPFAGQEAAILERWLAAGFNAVAGTAALHDRRAVDALLTGWQGASAPVEAAILDYVGHDPVMVRQLQRRQLIPVYDLGLTTMTVLVHTMPGETIFTQ